MAEFLYGEFMYTLQLLQSTSDSRALKMWTEDLMDLHEKAQHLLNDGHSKAVPRNKLFIITGRTIDTWLAMARTKNVSLNNAF